MAKTVIVLLGFMGAGKSTIAEILAQQIGSSVVDLDHRIEACAGKLIPDIFRDEGEPAFRRLETEALHSLVGESGVVIATGGGVVQTPENLRVITQLGTSVYLRTKWKTVCHRVGTGEGRPLARDRDKMRDLFERRQPLYEKADLIVDTDGKSPEQVAKEILQKLEMC